MSRYFCSAIPPQGSGPKYILSPKEVESKTFPHQIFSPRTPSQTETTPAHKINSNCDLSSILFWPRSPPGARACGEDGAKNGLASNLAKNVFASLPSEPFPSNDRTSCIRRFIYSLIIWRSAAKMQWEG